MASLRLRVEGRVFKDRHNREVTLHGINCAGDAKLPSSPNVPSHVREHFFEGDHLSFAERPFSVDEAPIHFERLKRYGYNTIRYIFTWEAIEHEGPGKYDEQWIQHTIDVLRCAREYGFFIFMDPHQDVWSRFSGGSGAPMWTLYAVGLDPQKFAVTEAALTHNAWSEGPENFPKMIWSTNYWRLACQVIFTLFFGGRDYAPKAIIDGKNIQDYLQEHFVGTCKHLAQRIKEAGDVENEIVIGWESMNEPNKGLIGHVDLSVIPSEQKLQKGTSPTAWQAILLGSGRPCEVDTWEIGGLGPYKTGSRLVDPRGTTAWVSPDYDDTKYGWKRDPGWKLGECIWAQHGIWDPQNDRLLKKEYFSKDSKTGKSIDYEYFNNHHFMEYYRRHRDAIKSVHREAIMFLQGPVLEIPPSLKGTKDDSPDMVYTPHYYDGITLLTKKWNRYWNVDVFGILRGKYLTPAFAIKIGETAIRNSFKEQLTAIRQEGIENMGEHPCVFSEIGIPYDMDDKAAYKTGDYMSQSLAMDANHYALEGSGIAGYTLWTYMGTNNHELGDLWNGEDLSIFSLDDKALPTSLLQNRQQGSATLDARTSEDASKPSFSQSRSNTDSQAPINPENLKGAVSTPSISRTPSVLSGGDLATSGYRAAEAYVRPSPLHTVGTVKSYGFDLRNGVFNFTLVADKIPSEEAPTEMFLPEYHFPRGVAKVEVSSGKWTITVDEADHGMGLIQRLRWWHGKGEQSITVRGLKRKIGAAAGREDPHDEPGYLEQCQQTTKCEVM